MRQANKTTQIPYGDTIRKQMKAKVVLQMRKKMLPQHERKWKQEQTTEI